VDLQDALPGALATYFNDGEVRDIEIHLENELLGVVVRVAQDHLSWDRHLLAARLASTLGVGGQSQMIRSGQANLLGDIVYAMALPSDTVGWLTRQMDTDGDAITVAVPTADELIWTGVLTSAANDTTNGGIKFGGTLFPAAAPFGEVIQADAAPQHIRI
jgi:hypothetical protein